MRYVYSARFVSSPSILRTFLKSRTQLRDVFAKQIRSGQNVIDVFHWTSLAALEFIGRGGLGHAFDALNLYKKNEYNEYIKAAM